MAAVSAVLAARRAARFALWTAVLRARLRRHGARLVVEAPHGVPRFDSFPHLVVTGLGDGDATLRLAFGRGVSLGRDMTLEIHARGTNELRLGDGVYLLANVRLQLHGGHIRLGAHSHVRDSSVLKATAGAVEIGERVTVSFHCVLAASREIRIGDHAALAERVTVIDSDHSPDGTDGDFLRRPLRYGPVDIGPNVFVAANAVVLRGVRLGANSAVAAGAVVVRGDYPPGWLIAGVPAEPKRPLGAGSRRP